MDWILIGTIVITAWAMLSVLSSERLGQAQRMALALATAAAEQTKNSRESQIPTATAGEPPPAFTTPATNRKR